MTDYPRYTFRTVPITRVATRLIQRIEGGGHDLELSREIATFLFDDLRRTSGVAKALNGDLQAAIEMFDEVLPGWVYKVCRCHLSDDAWVVPDRGAPKHAERFRAVLGDVAARSEWDLGFDVDLRPPRGPYPGAALLIATIGGVDVFRARVAETQNACGLPATVQREASSP